MKNLIKSKSLLLLLLVPISFLFIQCDKDDDTTVVNILQVDGNGNSSFNNGALQNQLDNMPKQLLSTAEETGLLFMREEEKLAHDVYVNLYEKWTITAFNNIAQSEQTHTDAVKLLLDKYDLTDPVGNNGIGVFVDTTLENLYNHLMVTAMLSEIEALKIGAAIEEIDILDLENQLTEIVDNNDISLVYENLQKGSRNHLRAFVKNLKNRGLTYTPQYLSLAAYQAIIDGDMETGGN